MKTYIAVIEIEDDKELLTDIVEESAADMETLGIVVNNGY